MIKTRRSGAVGILTLDRPEARNALSRALIGAMSSELDALQSDAAVKVILLTGDPVFCAGADVAEMKNISLLEALAEDFSGCCERLAKCSKCAISWLPARARASGIQRLRSARFREPVERKGWRGRSGAQGPWT